MAVEFSDIYTKAIGLIDDPVITQSFENNPISFFKIMYSYFQNAIPLFVTPDSMIDTLSNRNSVSGQVEIFDGDGVKTTFPISTTPLVNSFFRYTINGIDTTGTYNSTNNTITFATSVPNGQQGTFEWYFCGEFLNNIDEIAQEILAKLLVLKWAEKEKNFLLDIRRLLNDTDFHLGNEAGSIRAKTSWYMDMRDEVSRQMNRYAWVLQYKSSPKIRRF